MTLNTIRYTEGGRLKTMFLRDLFWRELRAGWFLPWVSVVYSFEEDEKWSKDFLVGSVEGTCHF